MPKIIDHDQYRRELLRACIPIFANNSYGALSMRHIAYELGVSTGTLYHYFTSKEDIFTQLVKQMAVESIQLSASTVQPLHTLEERLDSFIHFIRGYEEGVLNTVLILSDFTRTAKANGQPVDSRYSIDSFDHIEWTARYLQVEDKDLVRHFLFLIQGVVIQRYMDGGKTNLDKQLHLAKEMFLSYYQSRRG